MKATLFATLAIAAIVLAYAMPKNTQSDASPPAEPSERVERADAEWRRLLGDDAYRVLRQRGTEPAFRNAYWNHKESGDYVCAGCQAKLFSSDHKYDSGTGWPSFYEPAAAENVGETVDRSHGMVRAEVHCRRCGGHLGHRFPDGPQPTGQRYCINSASLEFVPAASGRAADPQKP